MMYPFLQLNDGTEIVHSEMFADGTVKIYVERPVESGFNSAYCILPQYQWVEIVGFTVEEINEHQKVLESTAHLIIKFAQEGGFNNAAGF